MTALDRVLPAPRLSELDHVDVAVPAEQVWATVRHRDFARRSALVRALFAIRTLTEADAITLRIDDLRSSPDKPGFQILVEDAPREVVVGAIGKVWQVDIPFVHVAGDDDFARFDAPGFVKVAWALRVLPRGEREARIEIEVRVDATDEASWRKFRAYFSVIGIGSRLIRRVLLASIARELGAPGALDARDVLAGIGGAAQMLLALMTPFRRGARSHWGIDEDTARRAYPGDELIAAPRWTWTHGIEIGASAEAVWPWIAQIGAGKGGLYSYEWLENLAGCGVRNAETIHPEWEAKQGGELRLHPAMPPLRVHAMDRGRWFVVYGAPDDAARAAGKPWVAASWLFHLEPLGPARCRLVSRYRAASSDDLPTRLSFGPTIVEPVGFAMDRRMLLGVRDRAELRP